MRFEEKLRKQMLLKGLNQQGLARLSGVSDSEVSRILGGKSQPGLENALRLAQAVGVSLDYLTDDTRDDVGTSGGVGSGGLSVEEREVLAIAHELGARSARRILDSAQVLGFEVAIRRLHGAEMKPIIEVGEGAKERANSA